MLTLKNFIKSLKIHYVVPLFVHYLKSNLPWYSLLKVDNRIKHVCYKSLWYRICALFLSSLFWLEPPYFPFVVLPSKIYKDVTFCSKVTRGTEHLFLSFSVCNDISLEDKLSISNTKWLDVHNMWLLFCTETRRKTMVLAEWATLRKKMLSCLKWEATSVGALYGNMHSTIDWFII